jgi:hypothetical protein
LFYVPFLHRRLFLMSVVPLLSNVLPDMQYLSVSEACNITPRHVSITSLYMSVCLWRHFCLFLSNRISIKSDFENPR